MKFSVIVPVYNRAHSVGDALRSILGQTRPADEIIVVDDGSTDDLATALAPFMDNIILLRQANSGASAARNAGCARATGGWLTFLDSDDLWEPDRLAVLERDLSGATPEVVVHLGDMTLSGPGYQQSLLGLKGLTFPNEKATLVADPLPMVLSGMGLPSAAVRRDVWQRSGGLDPLMRIFEDTALFAQLCIEGPFLVTGQSLARALRLEEATSPLSRLAQTQPVYARQMYVRVFEKLMERSLTDAQRNLVRRKLSGAQIQLAEALSHSDKSEERKILRLAARNHPSPLKGWAKSVAASLPRGWGYRMVLGQHRGFDRK